MGASDILYSTMAASIGAAFGLRTSRLGGADRRRERAEACPRHAALPIIAVMKLDSKFFDRLRVKPDAARLVRDACPSCEWQGCREPGLYPAPKGRGHGGRVSPLLPRACPRIQQVLQLFRRHAGRGRGQAPEGRHHRPPPDLVRRRELLGAQSRNRGTASAATASPIASPPSIRSACWRRSRAGAEAAAGEPERILHRAERKCLRQLNLEDTATKAEIKARFKELG